MSGAAGGGRSDWYPWDVERKDRELYKNSDGFYPITILYPYLIAYFRPVNSLQSQ